VLHESQEDGVTWSQRLSEVEADIGITCWPACASVKAQMGSIKDSLECFLDFLHHQPFSRARHNGKILLGARVTPSQDACRHRPRQRQQARSSIRGISIAVLGARFAPWQHAQQYRLHQRQGPRIVPISIVLGGVLSKFHHERGYDIHLLTSNTRPRTDTSFRATGPIPQGDRGHSLVASNAYRGHHRRRSIALPDRCTQRAVGDRCVEYIATCHERTRARAPRAIHKARLEVPVRLDRSVCAKKAGKNTAKVFF
jgi:hypothetical protein